MLSKENPLIIAVSRKVFPGLSEENVFARLARCNQELGVSLGMEIIPHRLTTVAGFQEFSSRFGIKVVGVHGPLQAENSFLIRAIFRNLRKKPVDYEEIGNIFKFLIGFGSLNESRFLKRYGTHAKLAQALNSYLVMHMEPLQAISDEVLSSWLTQGLSVLRENGWGPKDGLLDPLSWDPKVIREYCDRRRIGTLLDTATAARAGLGILKSWEILKPEAIHLSDRKIFPSGQEQEHLEPGKGDHSGELRELLGEVKKQKGVVLVIEISAQKEIETALKRTLDFIART